VQKKFEPPELPPPPEPETFPRWISFTVSLQNSCAQQIFETAKKVFEKRRPGIFR
jgi:hypothetical protein